MQTDLSSRSHVMLIVYCGEIDLLVAVH